MLASDEIFNAPDFRHNGTFTPVDIADLAVQCQSDCRQFYVMSRAHDNQMSDKIPLPNIGNRPTLDRQKSFVYFLTSVLKW
jgi:hypothetical protein